MTVLEALDILGLDPGYNLNELQANWRILVKKYHPDVNHEYNASDRFILITTAYELLSERLSKQNRGANQDYKSRTHSYSYQPQGHYSDASRPFVDYVDALYQFSFTLAPILIVFCFADKHPEIYQHLFDMELEFAHISSSVIGAFSKLSLILGS